MTISSQDRWDKLFEELGDIKTNIAVIVKRQTDCEVQISANTRTLRGNNGDVGLVAEVDGLKKWRIATTSIGVAILITVIGDIALRVVGHVY
jgi:hypothetical protein